MILAPVTLLLIVGLARTALAANAPVGRDSLDVHVWSYRTPDSLALDWSGLDVYAPKDAPRRGAVGRQAVWVRAKDDRVEVRAKDGDWSGVERPTWKPSPRAEYDAIRVNGRPYAGPVTFHADGARLVAVARLELESLVRDVVRVEAGPGYPVAAKAALAVVVRTFALAARAQRADAPWADLGDGTRWMLFRQSTPGESPDPLDVVRGLWLTPDTSRAIVRAGANPGPTTNVRSLPRGDLTRFPAATVAYSADAGGRTNPGEWLWGERGRLLEAVDDRDSTGYAYARVDSMFPWTRRLPTSHAGARLPDLAPGRLSWTTWATWVDALGWGSLPSPTLDSLRALPGDSLYVVGRGLGHGVGLCMAGARGRALAGQSWAEILAAYFPRLRVVRGK